jgi:hypothetical protein
VVPSASMAAAVGSAHSTSRAASCPAPASRSRRRRTPRESATSPGSARRAGPASTSLRAARTRLPRRCRWRRRAMRHGRPARAVRPEAGSRGARAAQSSGEWHPARYARQWRSPRPRRRRAPPGCPRRAGGCRSRRHCQYRLPACPAASTRRCEATRRPAARRLREAAHRPTAGRPRSPAGGRRAPVRGSRCAARAPRARPCSGDWRDPSALRAHVRCVAPGRSTTRPPPAPRPRACPHRPGRQAAHKARRSPAAAGTSAASARSRRCAPAPCASRTATRSDPRREGAALLPRRSGLRAVCRARWGVLVGVGRACHRWPTRP